MKKYTNLCFEDIGRIGNNDSWKLSVDKLEKQGIRVQYNWGDQTNISSYVILEIMRQKNAESKVINTMDKIRTVEKEVRNLAAHQIVGVTAKWIEAKTKLSPEEIMDSLFELAEYVGLCISKRNREIYLVMNEELIESLHIS